MGNRSRVNFIKSSDLFRVLMFVNFIYFVFNLFIQFIFFFKCEFKLFVYFSMIMLYPEINLKNVMNQNFFKFYITRLTIKIENSIFS